MFFSSLTPSISQNESGLVLLARYEGVEEIFVVNRERVGQLFNDTEASLRFK